MSAWKATSIASFTIGFGLVLLIGPIVRGEERFDREINALVDDIVPEIKKYIDNNKKGATVTVSTFTSRSNTQPSPGTSITLGLKEGLKKQGIPLAERDGTLMINGIFQVVTDPVTKVPSTFISCTINDYSDPGEPKILVTKKRMVVDAPTAIVTGGLNLHNDPKPDEAKLGRATAAAIAKPAVVVEKSNLRVRTSNDSPYAIEVWVNGHAREIEMKDGVPYVQIKTGESFAVMLINGSKNEAGISLSIDGINSFSFQDRDPKANVAPISDWTVPTSGVGYVEGWFINPKRMDKFELTDNPKEIAALAINADDSDVGTITAVFKASWSVPEQAPDDEPKTKNTRGSRSAEIGVKRGAEVKIDAPPRDTYFGVIRDSITIRYNKKSKAQAPEQAQSQARAAETSTTRP